MNLSDLPRTRTSKLLAIEKAIEDFSPDYLEADDIIVAVWAQLRHKYEDGLGVDLEHEFKSIGEALQEADATLERAQDEMTLAKWEQEKQREEEELMLRSEDERQS